MTLGRSSSSLESLFGWWFMDRVKRFKLSFKQGVGGALVVLALGTAFNLKVQQSTAERATRLAETVTVEAHDRCVETAQRAAATRPALAALVTAHRLDGDPHATAVWQQYLDAAKKNPIPKC